MNQKQVQAVREFNRFYTRIIGLLDKYILNSHLTLPEVRVLYEIYNDKKMTASDIISRLKIDKGYLSRLLKQFEKKKMILKVSSKNDKRRTHIILSEYGKKEFEKLNQAATDQIISILKQLSNEECNELVQHMNSIKSILKKVRE